MHAFESLEAARTALVAIDLMAASFGPGSNCPPIVAPINQLADGLRQAGGTVAWVTVAPDLEMVADMSAIVGAERARTFREMARPEDPRSRLWHELDVRDGDLRAMKRGASAFFPGKCPLPDLLRARGIESLLIVGTVTNVCCESSARDAVELGYRVTLVSDCLAGHAHGLHEATLNTFYRIFGDVRPSGEILDLLAAGEPMAEEDTE